MTWSSKSWRAGLFVGTACLSVVCAAAPGLAQTTPANPADPAYKGSPSDRTPSGKASASASANAKAPADPAGDEKIVVTSRKRAELLQKIPVAVDVLSHKQIVEQGVRSLADIAALTPGLTFDQGVSSLDSRPSIRGFYDERGRPSVAILIDGFDTTTESIISAGGGFPVNLNLLDLQRVEVVKGPQSALYGRNAFGGAVNYVTAKPTAVPSGEFTTEVGDYGDYKVFGTYSQAINDKVSVRGSLESDGINGFYDNTTTGKALGGNDGQGGSLDWLIRPNDALTVRVYTEFDHVIQRQQAAVNLPSNALLPNLTPGAASLPGVPQVVGTLQANGSEVAYTANYPGTRSTSVRNTVSVDYDLPGATFSSRTGFQTQHVRLTQDTDYEAAANPFSFFAFENELQDYTADTTQVQQELRLTSRGNSRFQWLAGLYLFYEGATLDDDTQYYLDHPSFIYPFARTAPTSNSAINPATETTRDTYHASVYGSVGYRILDGLTATAEVRVAYEGVDVSLPSASRTAITEYNNGITRGPGGIPLGISTDSANTVSRYVNPKFALAYELSPNINLYGNISRGTKPAGYSLLNISGGGFADQAYKQEKVWEYELGGKTSWLGGRLGISADIYFNDYRDQQVPFSNTTVNPPTVAVTNAGAVYGIGQELEIFYRPLPGLVLNAAYNHIDEYYENYKSKVASDLEYVGGDFDGKKVPDVAPHSVTASLRYEVPVYRSLNGFMQGTMLYESARYGNDYNSFKLGAYIAPRFQIGIENQHYSLLFFINNPFNDRTIQSAIGYFDLHHDFYPTALAILPPPRTFGARFNYHF